MLSDLAAAWEENAEFEKAHGVYTKPTERDPKNLDALLGLGRLEIKRGHAAVGAGPADESPDLRGRTRQFGGDSDGAGVNWVAYRVLGKTDEALNYLNSGLEIAKKTGRKRMEAEIVLEMSRVYFMLGKLDVWLKNAQQALTIQQEIKNQQGIGDTLVDFEMVSESRGDTDRALTMFKDSLSIQRDQRNTNSEAVLLLNIGMTHFLRGESAGGAHVPSTRGVTVAEQMKNPGFTANLIFNLGWNVHPGSAATPKQRKASCGRWNIRRRARTNAVRPKAGPRLTSSISTRASRPTRRGRQRNRHMGRSDNPRSAAIGPSSSPPSTGTCSAVSGQADASRRGRSSNLLRRLRVIRNTTRCWPT